MQKKHLILLPFLLIVRSAMGQSSSPPVTAGPKPPPPLSAFIKGKIADTVEKRALFNASVLLLRKEDSVLVRFTRTDPEGNFLLDRIPRGKFRLLVTCPDYADYVDDLEIKDSPAIRLPPVAMVLKSQLLQEVVVKGGQSAIRMKGDTVEFRADSFYTRAGATVEDLLKKLPGIQVDRNGTVTAQGKTVQKVLVDGEEFFGDDPTLVTQNLRADMVDKVQLYDKKSDQTNFTGIDDGKRDKTINLTLKAGKKNGLFGKLSAGQGTDGYHDYQAMINLFRNKEKFAAYGIFSNTGKTGLNWQEKDKYGQNDLEDMEHDEIGDYYYSNASRDEMDTWDGTYGGTGYPFVKTGGLHYNNKWGDNKQSGNINYKAMQLDVRDSSSSNSEFLLPDTSFYTNSKSYSNDQVVRQALNASYEWQPDSSSSIKLTTDGATAHKNISSRFYSESLATDSALVNRGNRTLSSAGDTRSLNSSLLWRKKLAKRGRTLSASFKEEYRSGNTTGYLNSENDFYSGGNYSGQQLTDQYKTYHNQDLLLDGKLTYTEPLSAYSFLAADYGYIFNNNRSYRNSFNKATDNKYSQLDSLYSNDYLFNTTTQKAGLLYTMIRKKLRFNAGGNIGFTHFTQKDLHADTSIGRNFVNWYPQANLHYAFSNQKALDFRYNGNTDQPSIQEIQPLTTNEDPLNISIGNPGLRPDFRHEMSLGYNNYQVLTRRYMWANISYSFTEHQIVSSTTVDSNRKSLTQFVNLNGNHSLTSYISYSFKWEKPDINIGFSANTSQSASVSIINSVLNTTMNGSYSAGITLGKSKDNKYDLSLNPSATFTSSRSTVNTGVRTDYWSFLVRPDLSLYLPLKFEFHADGNLTFRQKTALFNSHLNTILLNGWIGKKLMPKGALLIKISANDLLNQNISVSRSAYGTSIDQSTNSTIRRYFMLSVVWNFTKTGASATR